VVLNLPSVPLKRLDSTLSSEYLNALPFRESACRLPNEDLLRGIQVRKHTETTPLGGRYTEYRIFENNQIIGLYFYSPGLGWYNTWDMQFRKSRDQTIAAILGGHFSLKLAAPATCGECVHYLFGDTYCFEACRRCGLAMPVCKYFSKGDVP
jgi:hypothetical protein